MTNVGTVGSSTIKVAELDRDGKNGITVSEVMDALKEVGINFMNKAKSEMVVHQFAGPDKKYSLEEFTELINKNPKTLNNFTVSVNGKTYRIKDGKINEYTPPLAPALDVAPHSGQVSQEATVVPKAPEPGTAVPTVPPDPLVEKHLERFKELTGITDDVLARSCLRKILAGNKPASIDAINDVLAHDQEGLKLGFQFNESSFRAFGVDINTGKTLTADEFLTNLESTILDFRGADRTNAPQLLRKYTEHMNFYVMSGDSKFSGANTSVFRNSALKALKAAGSKISDNATTSEIVKELLFGGKLSGSQLGFYKQLFDSSGTELEINGKKYTQEDLAAEISDLAKKNELDAAIDRHIDVQISARIYAKMPLLMNGLDKILTSDEAIFIDLYNKAKDDEELYKGVLQKYFESSGNVFDLEKMRPGLFESTYRFFANMFNRQEPPAIVGQGEAVVPKIAGRDQPQVSSTK